MVGLGAFRRYFNEFAAIAETIIFFFCSIHGSFFFYFIVFYFIVFYFTALSFIPLVASMRGVVRQWCMS